MANGASPSCCQSGPDGGLLLARISRPLRTRNDRCVMRSDARRKSDASIQFRKLSAIHHDEHGSNPYAGYPISLDALQTYYT